MKPDSELSEFHRFLGEKLNHGDTVVSPEEALDEWRAQHATEDDEQDDLEAIKEAIADFDAGDRGIPIEEFDREFCAKHGLPPRK
jgi:hypothetical protein